MSALHTLQRDSGVAPDGAFGKVTLNAAAKHFGLNKNRAAHFFAQTYHETGGYKTFVENLNYSAARLHAIFPNQFPTLESAIPFDRNPVKIANKIYANRMGNTDPNDGWTYRGRGAIQLTGKENYTKFGYLTCPDDVEDKYAFESAIKYFERLWPICDQGTTDATILAITKKINGGTIGLDERKALTYKFVGML